MGRMTLISILVNTCLFIITSAPLHRNAPLLSVWYLICIIKVKIRGQRGHAIKQGQGNGIYCNSLSCLASNCCKLLLIVTEAPLLLHITHTPKSSLPSRLSNCQITTNLTVSNELSICVDCSSMCGPKWYCLLL